MRVKLDWGEDPEENEEYQEERDYRSTGDNDTAGGITTLRVLREFFGYALFPPSFVIWFWSRWKLAEKVRSRSHQRLHQN